MRKTFKHFIWAVIVLTAVFSCSIPEEDVNRNVELESAGSLVASLESLEPSCAVFSCDLSVHPDAGKSFRAGIMYATSQKFTTSSAKRAVIENPVEGKHMVSIEGLTFSTTYHYATYVYRLGKYELSEINSFTTPGIEVDIEITDLQYDEVTVEGRVHLEEDADSKVRAGFIFSDSPDFASERTRETTLELDEEGRFKMRVTGLSAGTTYYYAYSLSQGSRKFVAPAVRFVTLDPYSAAFGNLDPTGAVDLSADGTSNSYILTGPGLYKFRTVKGNSDETVGDVAMISVFWETFGTALAPRACELINATSYKDGYAIFNVPEEYKEGNALIVAKDNAGDILWSWHIWLLSELPGEHVYANGAGVMMDRNLGALSMEKGDAKGFGLLYQWGRKDPFPGSAVINGAMMAAATAKMYITISTAKEGTIEFATRNPSTMILAGGAGSSDWLYYAEKGKYDNTRWQSDKTIYDPCPSGWRVPDGGPGSPVKDVDGTYKYEGAGIWRTADIPTGGGFPYPAEDYAKAGIVIPAEYCGEDAWYPAAGSINPTDATFTEVGRDGIYWSVTPCGLTDVYGFNFYYYMNNTGYVYHSAMLTRATAASVRCCRE